MRIITMKIAVFACLIFCQQAIAQTLPCFFQTAVVTLASSYLGNATTHDNAHLPPASQITSLYDHYGNNGIIFDGPLFYVGTSCVANHLSFAIGTAKNSTDSYHQHCVCSGGTASGQGCTVVGSSGLGTAGSCPGGGTAKMYDNTYDVGLYCVGGGNCTYGQLYADLAPSDRVYSTLFAAGNGAVATFKFLQAPVTLPTGNYAIGMATNCDTGSTAGTNADGSGGSSGNGGGSGAPNNYNCGLGLGEGGGYGTGAGTISGTWKYTTALLPFKYFSEAATNAGYCLIYDPLHDNTKALSTSLGEYSNGTGCTVVSPGPVTTNTAGQAPHIINYVIW